MLPANTERILARLKPDDRVLDVGGWAARVPPRHARARPDALRVARGDARGHPRSDLVCAKLSRAAKAGYVEVPTLFAELIDNVEGNGTWLGHEHHRWLVEEENGGLVFTHKPHSLHSDWRVRVLPRWAATMDLEDHLLGVFWEGALPARDRVVIGPFPTDELAAKVRARFRLTRRELAVKEARERARHLAARAKLPLRRAVDRAISR